jgi:hypothetical protein
MEERKGTEVSESKMESNNNNGQPAATASTSVATSSPTEVDALPLTPSDGAEPAPRSIVNSVDHRPPAKRFKRGGDQDKMQQQQQPVSAVSDNSQTNNPETPVISAESLELEHTSQTPVGSGAVVVVGNTSTENLDNKEDMATAPLLPQTPRTPPMPLVATTADRRQSGSSSPSPSDISSSSRDHHSSSSRRESPSSPFMSPITTPYISEVPPAPPSTPASARSDKMSQSDRFDGLATPMPYFAGEAADADATATRGGIGVLANANELEQQQQLAEGAVTPAPKRTKHQQQQPPPSSSAPPQPPSSSTSAQAPKTTTASAAPLTDDFSEWDVGDRYQLLRILGRGSYGEVAQALDVHQGRPDAYVAIKRITNPFDQEVDAVRLFREIHILRQLKKQGHECVIQLLDVVQPPSEDLDDFHDLYLVFECTFLYTCIYSGVDCTSQILLMFFLFVLHCRCRYGPLQTHHVSPILDHGTYPDVLVSNASRIKIPALLFCYSP